MGILDVLFGGLALSMDATAIGMSDGMAEPKAKFKRVALIAGLFGFFQALMPLAGYYLAKAVCSVSEEKFSSIAGVVAFVLLLFIGGKMAFDGIKEAREIKEGEKEVKVQPFQVLIVQAFATAIDAFAFGISMRMSELSEWLFPSALLSVLLIGAVTFVLVCAGVYIGKKAGDKLADKATIIGGCVLILIAFKCLLF